MSAYIHKVEENIGTWKLIHTLGIGGNAEVWKAKDIRTESISAVKILKNSRPDSEPFKRFKAEIEILSRLGEQKGILPIINFSLPDNLDKRNPAWLAMPIAKSITDEIGKEYLLEVVIEAITTIADTLAELAKQGIHHRDIKPANLYSYNGTWVIGDFGLVDYPEKEALTESDRKLGPLYYLAPEMLFNPKNANGELADVYSLAKTLWVLATGQTYPLPGEQRVENKALTLSAYSLHPKAYLIDSLIDSATRHNPKDRPLMAEFAAELHAWFGTDKTIEPAKDLSNIASRIVALMEPPKRSFDRYHDHARQVNELLNRFTSKLELLAGTIKEVGLPIEHIGNNSAIVDYVQHAPSVSGGKMLHKSATSIVVNTPGTYITLWSGVGIEYLDNEYIYIIAAHLVRSHTQEYDIVWSDAKDSIHLGSAQQELAIVELVNNLSINIPIALERYATLLEKSRYLP